MKSGQFVKGKIDGIQKTFKSPGIRELIPKDKMAELENCFEIGEYNQFFKQARALIKTVVTPAENTDGRKDGVINHTVIYSYDASVEHNGLKYIFDMETFVNEVLSGKRQLKMPPFPQLPNTDYGTIDPPSPLEWEGA
jgi:hypothetical protein